MANRFNNFIGRLFGTNKIPAPPAGDKTGVALPSLVPFSEISSLVYDWLPTDLSMENQLRKYESWVYACVSKIAQEFSSVNLVLYQRKSDGTIEELKTHPVLDLLDKVNPFTTLYDLKELTSSNIELVGNTYWWLVRNGAGQVIQIYPWLRPDRMNVVPSTDEFIKGYRYAVPFTNEYVYFDKKDIIHFKTFNPIDPYYGLGTVKASQLSIETDYKAQVYNYRFFKNQARPDAVLQFKDGITKDQMIRIQAEWESRHAEGNEHKIAILSRGEYKPMSQTAKDMDFLEQRKFSRDEIFSMFKVPKSMLGITEDVNYATAESSRIVFLKEVITPKVQKFIHTLNEFLLPQYPDGDSLFFDFEDPVPENQEMRMSYYDNGLRNGWLSPNEVRKMEGLPAFEGGDNVYISMTQVPQGNAVKPPTGDQSQPGKAISIGTVDKHELVKSFNIKPPSRTQDQAKLEQIEKEVKNSNIIDHQAKVDHVKNLADLSRIKIFGNIKNEAVLQKVWEKVWENKIAKTNREERLFAGILRKEFERQRKQVLDSLHEKAYGFDFDPKKEAGVFAKIFEPELMGIIKNHGEDALNLLGLDKFQTMRQTRDYLMRDGLKFAKEVNQNTKDKIKEQIDLGIQDGESVDKIRDRVSGVFNEASTARATAIARTEVSRASNFGTREGYRQSGVVTYLEWFTAMDESVCPYCYSMNKKKTRMETNFFDKGDTFIGKDGKSISVDYENIADPPLHVNCRCVLIPHTDDVEIWDKEKTADSFETNGYDNVPDAEANRNAREVVNNLLGEHAPSLNKYADNFDWKLEYADVNSINVGTPADDSLVDRYVQDFKKGDQFPLPSAQILKTGDVPEVLDGAHRIAALKKLGAKIIPLLVGRRPE